MRTGRQFVTAIMLLVSYLMPAMACMASDTQMSAAERACCQMMGHRCEQMGMSASHGFCQKIPQNSRENALDTKVVTYHPVVVTLWLTASVLGPDSTVVGQVEHADYSPPHSPPGSISILRI
jgi:hypothetical protein